MTWCVPEMAAREKRLGCRIKLEEIETMAGKPWKMVEMAAAFCYATKAYIMI